MSWANGAPRIRDGQTFFCRLLSGCAPLGSIVMPHDVDNEEQGMPVWRCAAPQRPWAELWPDLRHIS